MVSTSQHHAKQGLIAVTPFVLGAMVWLGSQLTVNSGGARLLLGMALPIMLVMTIATQYSFDKEEGRSHRVRFLTSLFVVSGFSTSLFLEQASLRMALALVMVVLLFCAWRHEIASKVDVIPAMAAFTLFFSAYCLFGIAAFIEVPKLVLVVCAGTIASIAAREVFAHSHPEQQIGKLLVVAFAAIAMEFFVAISLLPTGALVGAALLSVPLASSILVTRALLSPTPGQTFGREFALCAVLVGLIVGTARWF